MPSRLCRPPKHAEIIDIVFMVAAGRIFARFLLLKELSFSCNDTPQTDESETGMELGLVQIKQMLIQRLQRQGVENCLIPGLLTQLASVFFGLPLLSRDTVNERLDFLGWTDFKLDEQCFQLVKACFEAENIISPNKLPANWFTANFTVNECT